MEELQQIEKFRISNSALYSETPLESDDPYTQRLIESLAFFSARARLQGTRKLTQIHQCLFRQYFPYLVNALPAFAMLQIKPSIRYPEKVNFPIGSELVFKTTSDLKATFQTLDALPVFPLFFKKFEFDRRGDAGWRFILQYTSSHISTEELGPTKLYINHLNSFLSSLSVAFALQYSLEKIHVFYDEADLRDAEGQPCPIHFDHHYENRRVLNHPVEQIRSFLHFPQQELFFRLDIPPAKKRWQSITLYFDFNNKWPSSLKLNADSFIPFVVPIVNLKTSHADPILHDGTKDSYPLLYPEPTHKYELHTVANVIEVVPTGTRPIKSGILGVGERTYEVDYFEKNILLHIPHAFKDPKTVIVEASWTQPWFSNFINEEFELQFKEAQNFGLNSRLLGSMQKYEQSLGEDPNLLIKILALKNQNNLSLHDILFIINIMKNLNRSMFDSVPDLIRELKIHKKVDSKNMTSIIEYEFFLNEWDGQKWELVVIFFKYVNGLLNSWLSNFIIETKVHFPKKRKPLVLKQGTKNELSVLARDFLLS